MVRDAPPLRSAGAIASRRGASGTPDVVKVPVPIPAAKPAPAVAPSVSALPHTGVDLGLIISAGLAMISAGLTICGLVEPRWGSRRDTVELAS